MLPATKSAKWAIADQIVVSGFNFLGNILLARILGIEEFGRYVLAWTIVIFIQGLQYSTVTSSMFSIGPKHDAQEAQSFFGAVFVHQTIFGLVSMVLTLTGGFIAAAIFPALKLDAIVLPLSVAVLFSQTQDFLRRYFFCVGRPAVSFGMDVMRYLGQNIAVLTMLRWFPSNSVVALWLITAAAAAGSLVALPYIDPLKYSFDAVLRVGLRGWHFSKWLVASTLVVLAFGNLFSFASGILLGAAAVGAMKATNNVVGAAHVVIEACVNVVPAGAARELMNGGRRGLILYLQKVTIYGAAAITPLLGIFVVAPKFWLRLFFGPEFELYWNLVPWWAGSELAIFLGLVIGTWYRTLESTKAIFYSVVFSIIVSLLLAYPLITTFGVTGAVAGLFVGQLAQVGFMLISARWMIFAR